MKHCIECKIDFQANDWTCPDCGFAPKMLDKWPTFAEDLIGVGAKEFDKTVYQRMVACEKTSFYFVARRRLLTWALARFFPEAKNFYDLGTGTGFVLAGIQSNNPDLELWGSDLAVDSLPLTTERVHGKATLLHTDAQRIPFSDHFDVMGAFDVIEHIEDDVGVLKDMYRAIKPGGGILLSVPQHMAFWCKLDDDTGHQRRYVGNELARKTREAGFDVKLDTCFMASLFLPQYVSRKLQSLKSDVQFEDEHNMPRLVNAILSGVLSLELAIIKAGMRFPFGGTRLVAARKPVQV